VILDEIIGAPARWTLMSPLAAEHIAADVKPRTLFATHYHELTDRPAALMA
jgi:hypothetical protein